MYYKIKYNQSLEKIKELQNDIIEIKEDNNRKHWNMLCRIDDLIKEKEKILRELAKYKYKEEKNDNGTSI